MGGVLLWFLLTAMLPWGGGTWLAGLAFGGRWNAGQAMMQDASPAAWEPMVGLYKACHQDSTTELCEAAIAARTITPGQGQEGAKTPAFGTVPAPAARQYRTSALKPIGRLKRVQRPVAQSRP